jgi:hypothetical protein
MGSDGATRGEAVLHVFIYSGPGKLKFMWKLSDIPQIKIRSNHGSRGSDGATVGETVFTDAVGNIFYRSSFQEPLRQKSLNLHANFMT